MGKTSKECGSEEPVNVSYVYSPTSLPEACNCVQDSATGSVFRFERRSWKGIAHLPVLKELPNSLHDFQFSANFNQLLEEVAGLDNLDIESLNFFGNFSQPWSWLQPALGPQRPSKLMTCFGRQSVVLSVEARDS